MAWNQLIQVNISLQKQNPKWKNHDFYRPKIGQKFRKNERNFRENEVKNFVKIHLNSRKF